MEVLHIKRVTSFLDEVRSRLYIKSDLRSVV
jgi:hypothetical protein